MKRTITSRATTTNAVPCRRTLASLIALLLAQPLLSASAYADSATGVNTTQGNALNPVPINPTAKQSDGLDADGMGLRTPMSHTPSGQMYNFPNADAEEAFKDPAFAKLPNSMPSGQSLIWGMAKETGRFDSVLYYPGEDGEYDGEGGEYEGEGG